jgi:hypothetical protein
MYPDLSPQTPFTMGSYLYPEVFLRGSDEYMSTLMEYLIHRKYKNVVAIMGNNQSDSVMKYLDNRKVHSIENELKITAEPENIIKGHLPEEIIEKHALMDVMLYGKDIFEIMEDIQFKTSYEMIKKHYDPKKIDSARLDQFRLLHYQFMNKYQGFAKTEYNNGKKTMNREFLTRLGI